MNEAFIRAQISRWGLLLPSVYLIDAFGGGLLTVAKRRPESISVDVREVYRLHQACER